MIGNWFLLATLSIWLLVGQIAGAGSVPDRQHAVAEGFETGNLTTHPWQLRGDKPWLVVADEAHEGTLSVRSGGIGDQQRSVLALDCGINDDCTLSFWLMVECESDSDYLAFFIDGQEQARWSGEVDWTNYVTYLTSGRHHLSWVYSKDLALSVLRDAAWIDDVTISRALEIDPDPLSPASGAFLGHEPAKAPWAHTR